MRKVLFVHPSLNPPGGGNAVAVWMLQALRGGDYDVTALLWETANVDAINRFYGTSLQQSDFTQRLVPGYMHRLGALDPDQWKIQNLCWLMRMAKRVGDEYNVIVSAENELDLGRRAVQYIHYPWFHQSYERTHRQAGQSWISYFKNRLKYHHRPWRWISGFSWQRMADNLTLVNSDWTGNVVRECYGIEPITLYPPVPGRFPDVSWEDRENGFLCIGRIAPVKELRKVFDILSGVRAKGFDVHLHLAGSKLSDHGGLAYYDEVLRWVDKYADWVSLHQNISLDELQTLIATHRYGIHGAAQEHFGIAVAQMMIGGMIVFVPNSGGQVEIVGDTPGLRYESVDDAVTGIVEIVDRPDRQRAARAYLEGRRDMFSAAHFVHRFREIVDGFEASGGLEDRTEI